MKPTWIAMACVVVLGACRPQVERREAVLVPPGGATPSGCRPEEEEAVARELQSRALEFFLGAVDAQVDAVAIEAVSWCGREVVVPIEAWVGNQDRPRVFLVSMPDADPRRMALMRPK